MQTEDCKEICKHLVDFKPYPSTEQVKAMVHYKLDVTSKTRAKKAVGHAKYYKIISMVSACSFVRQADLSRMDARGVLG